MPLSANGRAKVTAAIEARRAFEQAAMSGRTLTHPVFTSGKLPVEYRDALREAVTAGPVYVVFSYETPIAWFAGEAGWTVPAVRYSPTTDGHLRVARAAFGTADLLPTFA